MFRIYKLNRSFIFQIFIVLYSGSEIGLIASDSRYSCLKQQENQNGYFLIYIGIFSCILFLNIISLIYIAKKKQVPVQELANIVITILLQEYINLDSQIYSLTFCVIILIILYSYCKLFSEKKNHLALLILLLHLGYIFLRIVFNSNLNKQQIFQFSIVLAIIAIKVLPFQDNLSIEKNIQGQFNIEGDDISMQQLKNNVKQIPQIVINNNAEENKNSKMKQYQQKNEMKNHQTQKCQSKGEISKQTSQLKNQSKQLYPISLNNLNEKYQNSIPNSQYNINYPKLNQQNKFLGYFDTLSSGILFIDNQKNIFAQNDSFLELANNYLIQYEDLNINDEVSNQNIKKDQLLDISLVYEIKHQIKSIVIKKSHLKNEQSLFIDSKTTDELPDANKLIEYIQKEKEIQQTNQKKNYIFKNNEVKQKQNIQNLKETIDQRQIQQDLNVINCVSEMDIQNINKDSRQNNLNINQSSFYHNNSQAYCISENFQQYNTYMETDSAINYNEQQTHNESNYDFEFQNSSPLMKNTLSQCQGVQEILQKSKQCHISINDITEFFETECHSINLGGLVEFIIEQKSQIAEKEVIELSSSQVPEDYKRSKTQKSKQSMQLGSYMVKVQNNYIVISMIRKNKNYIINQKEVIELKIGCFYYEQVHNTKETSPATHYKYSKQIIDNLIQYKGDNNQNSPLNSNQKVQFNKQSTFKNQKSQLKSNISCGQIIENSKEYDNISIEEQNEIFNTSNLYLKKNQQVEKKYFITVEAYEVGFNIQKIIEQDIDKFRSKILCSISHELRTPLNCIITMLDMLNFRDDVPEISKNLFVNPALFSSYILLNIINDILDMAEVNRTGQISMIFSEFCPVSVCLECLNFIKLQAVQKNLLLEIYCDDNVPSIIYTDINKTRQVILNLLNNALKYTQKGTITIKLSYPFEQTVQIDVKDTGCGIPSHDLKQIFRNFVKPDIDFRRHSSIKKRKFTEQNDSKQNKNAGLGLSISYFLAACLGNNRKLSVNSEVGKGSTFTFYLFSRSQNKSGCTLFPISIQQSNNNNMSSMHSREWLECDNFQHKQTQQTQQQQTPSIIQTHFSDFDNQLNSSPTILKGVNDLQEDFQNDMKDRKIVSSKVIRNNLHFNRKNNSSNCIQISHTPIQEEHESNVCLSKEDFNSRPNIRRQNIKRNTSFLANNFNKTTFQIIQQATTLHQVYSAHDIEDQCNSGLQIFTNSCIVPFITQDQNARSRSVSKKLTTDEYDHSFMNQTSLTSMQSKTKVEQSQGSKEFESNQRQHGHINIHCTTPKKQIHIYRNHTSSSKFIKDRTNQEMQDDIFNFEQAFKRMKHEDIRSQLQVNSPTIKSNKKDKIDSCNVLNESFDKKNPNSSFSPHVGIKPPLSIPNLFNQRRSNSEAISFQINQPQMISPERKHKRQNTGIQVYFQSHQNSANNLNFGNYASILSPSLIQLNLNIDDVQKENNDIKEDQSQNLPSLIPSNGTQTCILTSEELIQNLINQNRQRKCSCPQILIVDDSEFNIYALEIRLQMYSFIVSKANSGFQALEQIQSISESLCCKNYKLIFMDIDMPEKNGYETTEEIIKLCQKLSITVPSISAYSALIQESDKEQAFKSGMNYYLTKPFNQQAFENILIKSLLNKQ